MRLLSLHIICLIALLLPFVADAQQKEANTWYFGRYLGLDFNSGAPVALNDGQLNTTEGVATISDSNGNLLFYTDGIRVWNKLHQVMPNGTGLNGDPSSSQSAVVVPKIGDPLRYFVFTVDQLSGPKGLCYSVVNMSLDGGKGDVETKNVLLQLNVTEKITAVRHCNNRDIWVVTHGSASDIYYAFLVSPTGINTTPVISHTGSVLWGVRPPSSQDSTALGYMKASPDGSKIAAAHWTVNADVSDFNNATGVVSNTVSLFQPGDPHYLVYGIEFSPNSKLLYTTVYYNPTPNFHRNELFQYDISQPAPASIISSKQMISQSSDPLQVYAALQVAPDGKMYMAKNVYKHIAAIENPNVYGTGCNFVSNAIQWSLPNQQSSFGLPTFVQSYFYPTDSFTHTVSCQSLTATFNYLPASNVISVKWDFGDPASGVNNTSTQTNPTHIFSSAGTYQVKLIKFTNCGSDTIKRQLTTDAIILNLGADTTVCTATTLLLNGSALGSGNTFLWSDGSTNQSLLVSSPGLYWVEERNIAGCIKRDSINVDFKPLPVFNLGSDGPICDKDTLLLASNISNATSFLWSTGASTPTIKAYQAATYWCEVVKQGCRYRDSITITSIKPIPVVNLGNDINVCEGIPTSLDATSPGSTYRWQDGSTNPVYIVNTSGFYSVSVSNNGCSNSDTVNVVIAPKPRFTLGTDQYICPGQIIKLSPVLDPSWIISWQDGNTMPIYSITQTGNYSLTATNNCGSFTDDIKVLNGVCRVFVPNAFTPDNNGRNDLFKALGTELVTQFHLKVFDRAGQVIFETRDKSKGWDGRSPGGIPYSTGVFVYVITYTESVSPQAQFVKGTFTLIR